VNERTTPERIVAVLVAAPPLIISCVPEQPSEALVGAMLEDVVDLVADTPQVTGVLAAAPRVSELAASVAWPGMPIVDVDAAGSVAYQLGELGAFATSAVAVVVADVPDLPALLLGKLFSALAGPPALQLAVCPAEGGGLVAAAIPVGGPPDWLVGTGVQIDDFDALEVIQRAAPRGALAVGPGWHRIRSQDDLAQLDLGLEGWDATRALL
jgi:hypothetical protein